MPCSYPQKGNRCLVPTMLVKAFRIETLDAMGQWHVAFRATNNYQRLLKIPLIATTRGVRFVLESTWGESRVKVFSFEPTDASRMNLPATENGPPFADRVAAVTPADLEAPESEILQTRRQIGA